MNKMNFEFEKEIKELLDAIKEASEHVFFKHRPRWEMSHAEVQLIEMSRSELESMYSDILEAGTVEFGDKFGESFIKKQKTYSDRINNELFTARDKMDRMIEC